MALQRTTELCVGATHQTIGRPDGDDRNRAPGNLRVTFEALVHNVRRERFLAIDLEQPRDFSDNILGKAGKNLFAVGFAKSVHVLQDYVLVPCH
jgi:hypothetical protein